MNFAIKSAKEILETYKTADVLEIYKEKSVNVIKYDLPESVEGFFQNFHGIFIVYVNQNLSKQREKFVLWHELGHIFMHDCVNTLFMKENSFFNIDKCEKEANMFSAYMMLEEECDLAWAMEYFELSHEEIMMVINQKASENYVLL